ncbi:MULTISPECIES: YaaL family protein [Gracilibacillus]|uniref:DUF2508 domain-containing protein n=1 Tax=Gracilibacillus dipsosauri TaxID=178340 RepID=A0A317L2M8_9BACI|nr:YaaL family protein [Gracilibacillus dipsosauri]PWU70112.1 DUF2508 domain-containing protein [Gracilibacillus dipsosauri]
MAAHKKIKKAAMNQQLLTNIYQLKKDWKNLESIMERSIEPTEQGRFDLALAKAKYFYLLKEAKYRKVSAGD